MRIAQLAPPLESVPPAAYGATERVIHTLTEELVRRGHDVTLFASGDSQTSARLVPICEQSLWPRRRSGGHSYASVDRRHLAPLQDLIGFQARILLG